MEHAFLRLGNWLLAKRFGGHVFISGTGRAGTSFLVQLLTDLGLDTGYGVEISKRRNGLNSDAYFETARAGFERDLFDPDNPLIVKSPFLCDKLDDVLDAGIKIGHLIIPVRDIFEAAESRRYVQRVTIGQDGDGQSVAGGLWDTDSGETQETVLTIKLARLIEAGARHDIPMTFLSFPRFACDPDYTYNNLKFLLPFVRRSRFRQVFSARAQPELIHDFKILKSENAER